MTTAFPRKDPGMGLIFSGSILLHCLLFLLITRYQLLTGPLPAAKVVYEVDLLNLPVAAPQAGSPAAAPSSSVAPAPPPTPPPSAATMTMPSPKAALPAKPTAAQDAEEFSQRMATLKQKAEARQFEERLKKLRDSSGSGKAGMPDAAGSESGSDYTSYLHSRLTEAFKTTITYQSKDPEVTVRLVIDGKGRIVMNRIERSSGDRLFEDAAQRAIAKAARLLIPPPGGATFEHGFVFRPQGVGR